MWPPTRKEKTVIFSKKFPKGCIKDFKFWLYDEKMGEAVVVCEDQSYRLVDQMI
ncbi:hypothetical protein HanIR_Chr11g0524021 [Helianthus annuus]|nr:hypothetical protein HanIR_Chr11g0524021 [Helianthus annuus]